MSNKKVKKLRRNLASVDYKLKDPNLNKKEKKKLLKQKKYLLKKAEKLGVEVPTPELNEVPLTKNRSGKSFGGSGIGCFGCFGCCSKSKEDDIDRQYRELKALRDQSDREWKMKNDKESADEEAKIRRLAELSRIRNMERALQIGEDKRSKEIVSLKAEADSSRKKKNEEFDIKLEQIRKLTDS